MPYGLSGPEPPYKEARCGDVRFERGKRYHLLVRYPPYCIEGETEGYFSHVEGWNLLFSKNADLRNPLKYSSIIGAKEIR